MKIFILIVILTTIFTGCSGEPASNQKTITAIKTSEGEPVPLEIAEAMKNVSREQSQGLKDAKVVVHRVYEYNGYSWIEPIKVAKLIAVDVEFHNYNKGLDLDDVDIIDGDSNENYGSDPQIASMTLDGKLATDTDDSSWPENMGPLRMLLIYAFPKESKTIKLSYWGKELTPQKIPISGEGPSLPQPKPKKKRSADKDAP